MSEPVYMDAIRCDGGPDGCERGYNRWRQTCMRCRGIGVVFVKRKRSTMDECETCKAYESGYRKDGCPEHSASARLERELDKDECEHALMIETGARRRCHVCGIREEEIEKR